MSARTRWIPWAAGCAVIVVGGIAAAYTVPNFLSHRDAERRYAEALDAWNVARDSFAAGLEEWNDSSDGARTAAAEAEAVVPDVARPYLDAELLADVDGLLDTIEAAQRGSPDASYPARPPSDPETTDELNETSEALSEQVDDYLDSAARFADAARTLSASVPELDDAVSALRESIPAQAERLEEANISATAESRIRLYYAAQTAATSDESVDYYVSAYAEAAAAVEQSQRDELAEKDQGDGLFDARLEVEEFVRSITGGVRVDFDWNPIVNDLGEGDSAGGRVTWQYLDGGSATMELSNSIAAHWPDSRYQALVAHESGHVITAKCHDLLTDTFDGDAELMATAWAIGMSYTDAWGNGVNFYYSGEAPADELVDATLACR